MATDSRMTFAAEANTALRLGVLMLSAGAASYRVIRSVKRAARSMGFDRADVLVGFNTISCTFHHGDQFQTVVADVPLPGVNSSRIEALETTTHNMLQDYHTADEINAALDEIEQIPTPRWTLSVAAMSAGLACAGFAVLNQFGWVAALLVFMAAACGQCVRVWLHRKNFNVLGVTTVAAFVSSSIYLIVATFLGNVSGVPAAYAPGFIAAVLFLIPGFPLFTAFVDLARFDFTAGIPRFLFALEVIVVIMLTVTVVAMLADIPPADGVINAQSWQYLASGALASFVAVGCFALLFNSSRRMALLAATTGLIANVGRLWLIAFEVPGFLAAFMAALFIGVAGSQLGQVGRVPRVTVTIPASVVMIPGPTMYRAVLNFANGDTPEALYALTDVTLAVLFIAGGLIIARLITDPDWAFSRQINFSKHLDGTALPINT
ncbi:threonine/serine ThrE exporter family protein [Corynebacterium riegelii]|uniref:threonine/serine ThrE exporter family protein n=1 Tax=Corynebacterium riegelii TaxID=156976 RepID=UPI0023F31114|nr:threonine/serine exporter family protein [Corynebacterium riegelii]